MEFSRRRFLEAVSGSTVVATAGLAGCLGEESAYDCDTEPPDRVSDLPRPVAGDPDAEVTVAIFEDLGCPACAEWKTDQYPAFREEYVDPGTTRYEHWDFPIPASEWSEEVANAARGVQDRHDDEAFFEFIRLAYERQADHSKDVVGEIAEAVGADPCLAIADADHEPYDDVLMDDRATGVDWGVDGTPAAFVDGEPVQFATLSEFADAIGDAIESRR